jgi:hypothetical protein
MTRRKGLEGKREHESASRRLASLLAERLIEIDHVTLLATHPRHRQFGSRRRGAASCAEREIGKVDLSS